MLSMSGLAAERAPVEALLRDYCIRCHGAEKPKGQIRLDRFDAIDSETWGRVAQSLSREEMPPEDQPQPARTSLQIVVAWAENASATDGAVLSNAAKKLQLPGYGNYVDHDLLFREPAQRKAATPARIWRYDAESWSALARKWTGVPGLFVDNRAGAKPAAFPYQGPDHTFLDYANIHNFGNSTTELLLLETAKVAEAFVSRRGHDWLARTGRNYLQALTLAFQDVIGREPTSRDIQPIHQLFENVAKVSTPTDAYKTAFQAILLRPDALFRFEIGEGPPDEWGRYPLSRSELITAIGFALNESGPTEELRSGIQDPRDRNQLRDAVRQAITSPAARDRLLRFAREYFEYPKALEVFKDASVYDYHPEWLVEDADLFVLRILDDDRDVLKQLLTSSRYSVRGQFNYHGTKIAHIKRNNGFKDYHRNYNLVESDVGKHPRWYDFPAEQRAGILTHPAWLVAFSDNLNNQAIQRGRWVTTNLLGGHVPDAPVGVDARLPDDENLTLREKMAVTRAADCRVCHSRMDPTGLPFEQYDLFGRYRTEEKGRPVVTTGELWGQTVNTPIEFVHRLAASDRVRQVFLRHVFRFFLGRNETLDDAPTLIDMDREYQSHGGSLKAAIVSLLTSDSFVYRTRPPESPEGKP
jgi:hypothetical protein